MQKPTGAQRLASIVLTVAVPIVLFFTPLYLFVTDGFVRHEYNTRGFPTSVRFERAERERLSSVIIGYLRGRASEEDMASMLTDSGEVAMRPKEVEHIADVKGVMDGMYVAHGIALACALAAIILRTDRPLMALALRRGIWIVVGVIGLILLSSFVDFDAFFTRFHQVFFQANTWLFYETDMLIQLYPLPFWVAAVWKMGVVILLEVLVVWVVSAMMARRMKEAT